MALCLFQSPRLGRRRDARREVYHFPPLYKLTPCFLDGLGYREGKSDTAAIIAESARWMPYRQVFGVERLSPRLVASCQPSHRFVIGRQLRAVMAAHQRSYAGNGVV